MNDSNFNPARPCCSRCVHAIQVRLNAEDIQTATECRGAPPCSQIVQMPGPRGQVATAFQLVPRIIATPDSYFCGYFFARDVAEQEAKRLGIAPPDKLT